MKVLVVEDDFLDALSIIDAIEQAGHEVIGPATSVSAGLVLAVCTPPDVAFVDQNLGPGGSGAELLHALGPARRFPAVIVSGQEPAEGTRALAIGYVGKPFTPETIHGALEVAQGINEGRSPARIPAEMELF